MSHASFVPHSAQYTVQGQKENIYLMINLTTEQYGKW